MTAIRPADYILPRHKAVSRAIAYALAADLPDARGSLPDVLRCRLAPRERGALALMALVALEDEDRVAVLGTVDGGAGFPATPFDDVMPQAELWAEAASDEERRAHLFTAFQALKPRDRREFADYASRRAAP